MEGTSWRKIQLSGIVRTSNFEPLTACAIRFTDCVQMIELYGVQLVNTLMQGYRPAGCFSRFGHTVLYLDNITRHNIPSRNITWCNQEIVTSPAYGYRTVSRYHHPLITGPTDDIHHLRTIARHRKDDQYP